jgi:cytoskeleton protein RodZ
MAGESPVSAPGIGPGIGRALTQAREALKLSREQCAERLYLPVDVINALEDERFAALGAGVYARGHLRRYAGLVGADSAALEREMLSQGNVQPDLAGIATKALPLETRPRPRMRFNPMPWLIGLLVIAVVALIVWAVKSRPRAPSTGTTTTVLTAPVGADATPQSAPAAGASVAVVAPPAATPATGMGAVTANVRLGVTFVADGQLEVRDASNKVLYSKPGKTGSVVMLQGNAPFQIITGGPGNIAVQLDSRPVTLPSAAGTTAPVRITIDATGAASLAPTTPATRTP